MSIRNTHYITKEQINDKRKQAHFSLHCVLFNPSMSTQSPSLRTLLLQFFDEPDKVEDDPLAFRGDDALRVELDTLK
jgi:hypothetical protein